MSKCQRVASKIEFDRFHLDRFFQLSEDDGSLESFRQALLCTVCVSGSKCEINRGDTAGEMITDDKYDK